MINATAGTTVTGAFDSLQEISDIAKLFGIWMHVDASWGGAVLFSQQHNHLLKGIGLADSRCFNPHKMLRAPVLNTFFLTRHETILYDSNAINSSYLFQPDKGYDLSYDLGDKYIQCGRQPDMLKFWLMRKLKGVDGFAKEVDKNIANAKLFADLVEKDQRFLLLHRPTFANICFRHIPQNLQGVIKSPSDIIHYYDSIHAHTASIKEKLRIDGSFMINYQPIKQYPNTFRMICITPTLELDDFIFMLDKIAEVGENK